MLGKSTDRGKPWEQGNILQVVDSREDAQLRKLCDAGDETELDILLISLEWHIELLHDLAHRLERGLIVKRVEQRGVVLVDDYRYLLARLLIKKSYQSVEFLSWCQLVGIILIDVQPLQHQSQRPLKLFGCRPSFCGTQIEMKHGILRPFLLKVRDLQSLKQLAVTFEIRFQSRREQRLAKAAGTAHEYKSRIVGQLPYQVGLVYIDKTFFNDSLKGL